MLSVTLSKKILNESRTTTPIWTFCAGVQKNMDNNSTDVMRLGKITFMT